MERSFVLFQRVSGRLPQIIQTGEVSSSERATLPWAAVAHLTYRPQDNGLPADGELDRVGRIEDRLIEVIESNRGIYVGHVTSGGMTRALFYSLSEGPKSVTVKTGLLKKEDVPLEWRHDPDWSQYDLELQPTQFELFEGSYSQLWQTLAAHGDNHDAPREVDFAAIFPSSNARAAFLSEVNAKGFVLSDQATWEHDEGQFWCELNKTTAITPAALIPACIFLVEAAERHGGEFDGWACAVTI